MESNDLKLIDDFIQCKPVDPVSIRAAINRLMVERNRFLRMTSPNYLAKRAYAGKVQHRVQADIVTDSGETIILDKTVDVPWSSIKILLALIQKEVNS